MYHDLIDRIERSLDTHGLDAAASDLAVLADALERSGALPGIAGLIVDPTASEPMRLRAVGRAIRALRTTPSARVVAWLVA